MRIRALGIMLLVATMIGLPGVANASGTPQADTRIPHEIEAVSAVFDGWYPVEVSLRVAGYQPDGCNYPVQIEQRRDGSDIYVDIYRNVPPNVRCAGTRLPYDDAIRLRGEFDAGSYRIFVNDYLLELGIPDREPRPDPPTPPARLRRREATIDFVNVRVSRDYPADVWVQISGWWADGCATERVVEQDRIGRRVYIDVYQWVDPQALCDARVRRFDEQVRLDDLYREGEYTLWVNDYITSFSVPSFPVPPPIPEPEPRPIQIDRVDAIVFESYPMRVRLHVTGWYSSGCQSEVFVDQRRVGNEVYVDIYQLVNPMIMCPERLARYDEVIALDGGFVSGQYVIHVNDYILRLPL